MWRRMQCGTGRWMAWTLLRPRTVGLAAPVSVAGSPAPVGMGGWMTRHRWPEVRVPLRDPGLSAATGLWVGRAATVPRVRGWAVEAVTRGLTRLGWA